MFCLRNQNGRFLFVWDIQVMFVKTRLLNTNPCTLEMFSHSLWLTPAWFDRTFVLFIDGVISALNGARNISLLFISLNFKLNTVTSPW